MALIGLVAHRAAWGRIITCRSPMASNPLLHATGMDSTHGTTTSARLNQRFLGIGARLGQLGHWSSQVKLSFDSMSDADAFSVLDKIGERVSKGSQRNNKKKGPKFRKIHPWRRGKSSIQRNYSIARIDAQMKQGQLGQPLLPRLREPLQMTRVTLVLQPALVVMGLRHPVQKSLKSLACGEIQGTGTWKRQILHCFPSSSLPRVSVALQSFWLIRSLSRQKWRMRANPLRSSQQTKQGSSSLDESLSCWGKAAFLSPIVHWASSSKWLVGRGDTLLERPLCHGSNPCCRAYPPARHAERSATLRGCPALKSLDTKWNTSENIENDSHEWTKRNDTNTKWKKMKKKHDQNVRHGPLQDEPRSVDCGISATLPGPVAGASVGKLSRWSTKKAEDVKQIGWLIRQTLAGPSQRLKPLEKGCNWCNIIIIICSYHFQIFSNLPNVIKAPVASRHYWRQVQLQTLMPWQWPAKIRKNFCDMWLS